MAALVEAYVLIQTEVGRAGQVRKALGDVHGVESAEVVLGPYDVVARTSAHTMADLESGVLAGIAEAPGVLRTVTCAILSE